ncbi:MAG: 4-hydroxy-3-methylbut-2-enyl diphosphate reductase [Candidatus Omnitrophica bacterium]|nr:4-hydroxy-3-methylbut-2-enyl diphosphate reductase [Candidatus Omnitrophota bacterium]
MRLSVAKNIGFCSGVRRAIEIIERLVQENKKNIFCLGSVIHNELLQQRLKQKGIITVDSLKDIKKPAYIILPSHGVPPTNIKEAKRKGLKIVDVTCPNVSSLQRVCKKLRQEKYQLIILGDNNHPEIRALLGIAAEAVVISNASEIELLKLDSRIAIVSQTTQSIENFLVLVNKFFEMREKIEKIKELRIFNTICLDNISRQKEVRELANNNDAVFVIGSYSSANTKRLFNISRMINPNSFLIRDYHDISDKIKLKFKKIGIISGASTPDWLVDEIIRKIKSKKGE